MSSRVSRSALRKGKKDAKNVNVALVGLNRMSGSIGLGLRSVSDRPNTNLVFTVLGRDLDNEAMKTASRIGAVDNFNRTLQVVVEKADIIFVNMPLSEQEETFARLGPLMKAGAVVVDLSPLKMPAVKLAKQHFPKGDDGKAKAYLVGATPLVGFDQLYDEDRSIAAAKEYLFRNSDVLIVPDASTPPEAVKVVTDIAELLNMKPRFMDPLEHDGLASLTEGIPLLLSVLLFQMVQQSSGKTDILRASNTRFASLIENLRHVTSKEIAKMWRPNRDALIQQIDQMNQTLESFKALLAEDAEDPLVLESHMEQLLTSFLAWELRREKNDWDDEAASDLDNISAVGVPVIGQAFNLRRPRSNDKE